MTSRAYSARSPCSSSTDNACRSEPIRIESEFSLLRFIWRGFNSVILIRICIDFFCSFLGMSGIFITAECLPHFEGLGHLQTTWWSENFLTFSIRGLLVSNLGVFSVLHFSRLQPQNLPFWSYWLEQFGTVEEKRTRVYPFDMCKDMCKIFPEFHIKLLIKYVTPGFVDTGELSSSIQSANKFFHTRIHGII